MLVRHELIETIMIEDKILIYRFKQGSRSALQRIYEKYHRYLLTLAVALLNDVHSAEDVVHDFFVSFSGTAYRLKINGSLKWYLATCVANRARDRIRTRKRQGVDLEYAESMCSDAATPETTVICNEELQRLNQALDQIPYEQREAVILHIRGQLKFRTIAEIQDVPVQTVQSRYRYGLDKLRTLLKGQVEK